ncbi:hypothetical protein [Persephonella sp.]
MNCPNSYNGLPVICTFEKDWLNELKSKIVKKEKFILIGSSEFINTLYESRDDKIRFIIHLLHKDPKTPFYEKGKDEVLQELSKYNIPNVTLPAAIPPEVIILIIKLISISITVIGIILIIVLAGAKFKIKRMKIKIPIGGFEVEGLEIDATEKI